MTQHGCHNRPPLRDWHHAQDGYHPMDAYAHRMANRLQRIVQVPHVMTRDCQYTQHQPQDERCAGCCHQKGAE